MIGKTKTGYSAHCPDVLGCAAVGKTILQVVANMRKALELRFEGFVEDGDEIPKPRGVTSYRRVFKELDPAEYFLGHVRINTRRLVESTCRSQR